MSQLLLIPEKIRHREDLPLLSAITGCIDGWPQMAAPIFTEQIHTAREKDNVPVTQQTLQGRIQLSGRTPNTVDALVGIHSCSISDRPNSQSTNVVPYVTVKKATIILYVANHYIDHQV